MFLATYTDSTQSWRTDPDMLKAVMLKAVSKCENDSCEQKAWKFGGKKGGVSVITS